MVWGFSGNIAPLLSYGTDHFGLETAHHILRQVVQNITTFLNSLATDQNNVPFPTIETAAETSTLL